MLYTKSTMNKTKQPSKAQQLNSSQVDSSPEESCQLNRYVALCGIASRRGAVALIAQQQISVNGKIITTPGYRVQEGDVVRYKKRILRPEPKVYVLLNKPSGYITTRSDEKNRPTVLDLLGSSFDDYRLYPVGRLDMTTTGVLLLTNDGDAAQRLAHPSKKVAKIYVVKLDRPYSTEDTPRLIKGVRLDDGPAHVDSLFQHSPQVVEVTTHSGRNRIVRRLFEYLGYRIKSLERTSFAGLNTRGLPRGGWRRLTGSEIKRLGI
jgi:23S rRNA pseudouridine2605 synthase